MSKRKLDIFDTLKKISVKDREFYPALSDEERKDVVPLVTMRWLSGTRDARQIYFLNELVNPFVFNMTKHKGLLVSLMMTCTSGSSKKYYWNKAKSKGGSKTPAIASVVKEYFTYSSSEAEDVLMVLSDDDILLYAEQLGRQPDEIKAIKKELKGRERA